MEIVRLRHATMRQALFTLGEGLEELELQMPDKTKRLMRDGVIQRFEYCIDSFWKFFKVYLEIVQKISIESPSPRVILRLALDVKLITDNECQTLLDCVAERNLTSHTYNEETAEKIQSHIPFYYTTMKNIVERLRIEDN